MKHTRLLIAAFLVFSGMAFASGKPAAVSGHGLLHSVLWHPGITPAISLAVPPPAAPTIYAGWYRPSLCSYRIWVSVTPASGSSAATPNTNYYNAMWFQFGILNGPLITNNTYPPSTYAFPANTTVTIPIYPNSPTNYYLWVMDMSPGYTLYPASTVVTVHPPCTVRQIKIRDWTYNPPHRVAQPSNPGEADEAPDLLVKWKLEEVNPTTGETVFTLDNPPAWEAFNHAGMDNPFPGFNADDESSIAELQAGGGNGQESFFDVSKTYRITRSYRLPSEDEWTECAIIMAPQAGGTEKTMAATPITDPADLLFVVSDNEHKQVIFNTGVDTGKLHIVDISGKEMTVIDLQEDAYEYGMMTDQLPKGVYIVNLQSGQQSSSKKFVIE